MVRTRTIKEAAAYFREGDPQTCLTETAIRTLLRSGAVPSVKVGKKPCIFGGPRKLSYGRNRASYPIVISTGPPCFPAKNYLVHQNCNLLPRFYRREEIK